jgi:hypothetical protein
MERLYQIISRHFHPSEIAILAADMSLYVPNTDPNSMARELFSGARRNLRLDYLFNEIGRRKAALNLDLGPNLYELIAGTFNEAEAAQLARNLELDQLNADLSANGLIGWNNDDFFKNKRAQTLQETALKEGKYEALLAEMKSIRPSLDLTVFEKSVLQQIDAQKDGQPSISRDKLHPQTIQYIQNIYGNVIWGDNVAGDKFGGDKVAGDKAGGDIIHNDINGLLTLIEWINKDLDAIKADLRERDVREAAEELQDVKKELDAENPDGLWIARKLNNIAQIAGAAGAAAAAANQLGPHLQQAIQMAQSIFGG